MSDQGLLEIPAHQKATAVAPSYLTYFLGGKIPAIAMQPEYIRSGRDLMVRFIAFHLWIPYLLLSKRVQQTFIR